MHCDYNPAAKSLQQLTSMQHQSNGLGAWICPPGTVRSATHAETRFASPA